MKIKETKRLITSLREQLKNPKQDKSAVRRLMNDVRLALCRASESKMLKKRVLTLSGQISTLKQNAK